MAPAAGNDIGNAASAEPDRARGRSRSAKIGGTGPGCLARCAGHRVAALAGSAVRASAARAASGEPGAELLRRGAPIRREPAQRRALAAPLRRQWRFWPARWLPPWPGCAVVAGAARRTAARTCRSAIGVQIPPATLDRQAGGAASRGELSGHDGTALLSTPAARGALRGAGAGCFGWPRCRRLKCGRRLNCRRRWIPLPACGSFTGAMVSPPASALLPGSARAGEV